MELRLFVPGTLFACCLFFASAAAGGEPELVLEPPACEAPAGEPDPQDGCQACHRGIEPIRCANSDMFRRIAAVAAQAGAKSRCVVCHGGDATVRPEGPFEPDRAAHRDLAKRAHQGAPAWFADHPGPKAFYPDPGSPWINQHTCGPCHAWQVDAQWRSLMMTEAGKIQGTAWGFGGLSGYAHRWANYPVSDPGQAAWQGTDAFKAYTQALAKRLPDVFRAAMEKVPAAPVSDAQVRADPRQAAFTYIRGECQRCHLGVGGKQRHGDHRGMGCSACHLPYGNAGLYQGADPILKTAGPGHPLVHSIQATFDSPARAGQVGWTGIPVETCTTCHNRGRRIGVSFQGLMETAYSSPWTAGGKPQPQLHGKHYLHLKADLHHDKGFVCQDCHTSLDVHSPNVLIGAITAAVEIECTDCHGTPWRFPWELPLGHGDEYAEGQAKGPARGVSDSRPAFLDLGRKLDPADGFLLSARGNPIGNVVRVGDAVRVYLASGHVKTLKPLKAMFASDQVSLAGRVAMEQVERHLERMECYACHATWAPQCYGCHVKVDYGSKRRHLDWVAVGDAHRPDGRTVEYSPEAERFEIPGEIVENRSYLRWEDPALAQNGEGRVAPVVPGCQTTVTVVGQDGQAVVANHIFRIPDVEGAGPEGQRAIDMAPLHPHTVQKRARGCPSCHDDPKALGYGIASGRLWADPTRDHRVDLMTGDGRTIPTGVQPLVAAIPGLDGDWSRFVTEDGIQVQTVGHHLPLSRPLSASERAHLDRRGVCLACHQEIPDRSLAVSLLHHVGETAGLLPESGVEHAGLIHKTLLVAGWTQVLAMVGTPLALVLLIIWWRRRRRRARSALPTATERS